MGQDLLFQGGQKQGQKFSLFGVQAAAALEDNWADSQVSFPLAFQSGAWASGCGGVGPSTSSFPCDGQSGLESASLWAQGSNVHST